MQLRQFLKGIADAIRGKEGSTATIPAADFASRISNLPSGEDEITGLVEGTLTEFVNDEATSIKSYLFFKGNGNQQLKKVLCSKVSIVEYMAFTDCMNLVSVEMPRLRSAERVAFSGCKISNAKFPKLALVSRNAFDRNPFAQFEMFGGQNGQIDDMAFASCDNLSRFVIRSSESVCELLSESAFQDTPIARGSGYIYVPRSLVDAYKTAWSTYANQFRALEDYTIDGTTTGELDPNKI